ncbi:MAG: undecaprenyl-diphosphate phosphatase [Pyrinomonadaceae bacterium]
MSSTAHLIFASRLTDLYAGVAETLRAEQTTATIAVIQLGTLIAVFVYFAKDIWRITAAFIRDHLALLTGHAHKTGPKLSDDARLGWLVFIGSLPIGIVGLAFKKQIEGTFTKNLWVIATMMIAVAILLMIAEYIGRRERTMSQLTLRDALLQLALRRCSR